MAKYYSSTFGKISGKHGNAVAVIMKDGTTYLREYRKPSNPRTDKQQAHRAKFALSSKALVPFNPIFKETMGITNGISTARSHAFNNAIVGEYPSLSVDYEKLMFSFGPIERLQNASFTNNEGIIEVKWEYKEMYNCHKSDSINIIIFNKHDNQVAHLKDIALRSNKKCMLDIHDTWIDSELYLWAYVTRGNKMSDSVFVGNSVKTSRSISGLCVCPPDDYNNNSNVGCDAVLGTHNNNIKGTHTDSSLHYSVYQSIMSFIIMICNIFGLFTQVVGNIIEICINSLTYDNLNETVNIDYTHKARANTYNSYSVIRTLFKALYSRLYIIFQPIFTPKSIPIMYT